MPLPMLKGLVFVAVLALLVCLMTLAVEVVNWGVPAHTPTLFRGAGIGLV